MKKLLILTILLISVNSCATSPRFSAKQKGVDDQFKPYIQEYKNIIGNKHKSRFNRLSMNFTNFNSNVLGRCYWLLNGHYEIEIDKEGWDKPYTDFIDKQFVIYHELEHCIRYRLHSNRKNEIEDIVDFWEEIWYRLGVIAKPGYLKDGCPASIMHSSSFSDACQLKHYMYYINEIRNLDD